MGREGQLADFHVGVEFRRLDQQTLIWLNSELNDKWPTLCVSLRNIWKQIYYYYSIEYSM